MWRVDKPTLGSVETLRRCASRIRNADRKLRITSSEEEVWVAEQRYSDAAQEALIHTLAPYQFALSSVSSLEMIKLYEDGMVNKASAGREIYDYLIGSAPMGLCPFCGQRIATTLDHYLPKAHFPSLAVTPLNLVPSCIDCNKAKSTRHPASATEETLHPYFDDVEQDLWLGATIKETTPPSITFQVDPPTYWTPELKARVETHFKTFELNLLYSTYAASHLSSLQPLLLQRLNESGPGGVQQYLLELAGSYRSVQPNGWLGVMLMSLGNSAWFCTTGVKW